MSGPLSLWVHMQCSCGLPRMWFVHYWIVIVATMQRSLLSLESTSIYLTNVAPWSVATIMHNCLSIGMLICYTRHLMCSVNGAKFASICHISRRATGQVYWNCVGSMWYVHIYNNRLQTGQVFASIHLYSASMPVPAKTCVCPLFIKQLDRISLLSLLIYAITDRLLTHSSFCSLYNTLNIWRTIFRFCPHYTKRQHSSHVTYYMHTSYYHISIAFVLMFWGALYIYIYICIYIYNIYIYI